MELTRYKRDLAVDFCLWLGDAYDSAGISVECARPTDSYGMALIIGGEERDVRFRVGLPLLGGWAITLHDAFPDSWRRWSRRRGEAKAAAINDIGRERAYAYQHDLLCQGREIGISLFMDHLAVRLWSDPMDGKYHSVLLKDFFLGRETYKTEKVAEHGAILKFPEGAYEATIMVEKATRSRRFARTTTGLRFTVAVEKGVPHPGKGENSYDCEEDATYSICYAEVPFSADLSPGDIRSMAMDYCDRFVADVTETRLKRGGKFWKPEAMRESAMAEDAPPAMRPA